ncbi:MAG: glycosyltransferase [Bacteroidota bacterium]
MAAALTVLIPTHGRATLLERTLDSLAACPKPTIYRETVVVENGPQEGAEALVAARPAGERVRYLYVERANKSHALNEALETVAPGLVVFFDDDVRLAPDILDAYDAAAAGRERGAFFGGPFSIDYEEAPPDWLRPHFPFSARGVEFDDWPRPDYFLGFNWAAFADDIQEAGGFDPNHGPGSPTGASGQESSMQRLLRRRGTEQIKVPGARVWHYVPRARCSPAWALHRKYRAGLEKGNRLRTEAARRRLLTVAEYAARSALAAARWSAHAVLRNRQAQFGERAALKKHLGVLAGYLAGREAGEAVPRTAASREVAL